MNIFEFLTICPPGIKQFMMSDRPSQVLVYLEDHYRLTKKEGDQLTTLARDLLLGLVAVDVLPGRFNGILSRQPGIIGQVAEVFRQHIVMPNIKFLKQTEADVKKFKEENDLPEVVTFTWSKATHSTVAMPEKLSPRPVRTTTDIHPIKRTPPRPESAEGPPAVVPPATPVKPTAAAPQLVKEEKPKLDQFQLRTVDDLINVPPMALAKEPDDEKQLVGRFKQEIQDISNYSGAKRVEIVAGWKQSQIYHTYIEMGNDSIQQGKPISDVMAFRKTSGKPYLSENQFHAISEVSRLLLR